MATSSTVTVGCKLPNGLVLELAGKKHELAGARMAKAGGYGLTPVPADFWQAWAQKYAGFPPLEAGLIFAQTSPEKAADQAKEQASLRTGMEPLNPTAPAPGITPA